MKNAGVFGDAGRASVIGLHLVSGIMVGCLAGYWLDEWLDTSPWLKIVFFFLGLAAGFRNAYQDARRLLADQTKQDAVRKNGGECGKDALSGNGDGNGALNRKGGVSAKDALSRSGCGSGYGGGSGNNEGKPEAKS